MPRGDGFDDAPFRSLLGKLRRGPVSHRTSTVLGRFTGKGNDLRKLLCRELREYACSRSICQDVGQQFGQVLGVDPLKLGPCKALCIVCPSPPPPTATLPVHAKTPTHLVVADSV